MGSSEMRPVVPVVKAAIPESCVGGPEVAVALAVAGVPRLIFMPNGIGMGFRRVSVCVALVAISILLIMLRSVIGVRRCMILVRIMRLAGLRVLARS